MNVSEVLPIDDGVLRAAVDVISERGWSEITLERVASAAGVSRVTLYRRGITRELLLAALAARAAEGWRSVLWPALVGSGTAAERLADALRASCTALEQQLPLIAGFVSSGAVRSGVFVAPFERLLRDGCADGTLAPRGDVADVAVALFSTLPGAYLALRSSEGWTADRAATVLTGILMHGLLPGAAE